METSASGAMLNCSSRQPEGRELIEREDPVLSGGEGRDFPFQRRLDE
jgi:hypothetical protein